jgi:hypothetical protein
MRYLLCLTALLLAACQPQSTLIFRASPQWARMRTTGSATYDPPKRDYAPGVPNGAEVNIPPTKISDQTQLTMAALIQARQIVSDVAAAHGLALRYVTPSETQQRWTEIYTGPKGDGEIKVRESVDATFLEISVREPSASPTVRAELRKLLGLPE